MKRIFLTIMCLHDLRVKGQENMVKSNEHHNNNVVTVTLYQRRLIPSPDNNYSTNKKKLKDSNTIKGIKALSLVLTLLTINNIIVTKLTENNTCSTYSPGNRGVAP